jgi:hypothetical protein
MATLPEKTYGQKIVDHIDNAIAADSGRAFKAAQRETLPACEDAYSTGSDLRGHLGASVIGNACARSIWYGHRWAGKESFSGRMLRLFNTGHLYEGVFVAMLRAAGFEYRAHDADGNQFKFKTHGGHFAGSCDGVIKGLPGYADTWLLAEFKTHGESSFNLLKKEGVLKSKAQHYAQMQVYMSELKLPAALYLAINKNTSELYAELIESVPHIADNLKARAEVIILAQEAPLRISNNSAFFQCKFCNHNAVCHEPEVMPPVNCRTCAEGVPAEGGVWRCLNDGRLLDLPAQVAGCGAYTVNAGFKAVV